MWCPYTSTWEVSLWLFLTVPQHLDLKQSGHVPEFRCEVVDSRHPLLFLGQLGEHWWQRRRRGGRKGWLISTEVLHSGSSRAEEQITLGLSTPQVIAASQNKPRDQKIPASGFRAGPMMLWLFPSCVRESERHSNTSDRSPSAETRGLLC